MARDQLAIRQPDLLQVVAEPRRQEILRLVWNRERAAGDIAGRMDVTFGAVSQHLRILREAGLVSLRKQGRHRLYLANPVAMGPIAEHLQSMWSSGLHRLKQLAEAEENRRGKD